MTLRHMKGVCNDLLYPNSYRTTPWGILSASILGTICGILLSIRARSLIYTLMRGLFFTSVSIVDLLYTSSLPHLFLLLTIILSTPGWMIFICFAKAFSFGYCLFNLWATFGAAGWLIASITLCSHAVSTLLVIWFSLRHISGFRHSVASDWILSFVSISFLSVIENYLIAPLLVSVIIQ